MIRDLVETTVQARDPLFWGGGGGQVRDQGSRVKGGVGMLETRGLRPMVGVGIQDTRGLITGEVGLYKMPGVSSLGRGGYLKVPSPQHARAGP